jgi:hypothetical protein
MECPQCLAIRRKFSNPIPNGNAVFMLEIFLAAEAGGEAVFVFSKLPAINLTRSS